MSQAEEGFVSPWKEWAATYKDSPRATFKDGMQFELEAKEVFAALPREGARVFDVGCGNGASLALLLRMGLVPAAVGGCDILPEFVDLAAKALPGADVFAMDISDPDSGGWERLAAFAPDAVFMKRVFCNLSGRKAQRGALSRICAALPKGARLILIEPMMEGLARLNLLRDAFGLPPLTEPDFNEYPRWKDLSRTLETSGMLDVTKRDHSSAYYVGSRVLQPFFWPDDEPSYDHPVNAYFMKSVPNREGFGTHWIITGVKA